ncbi:MAG TPA: thermonuclease family protein [Bacteriovoracaceae bacterium]|nr:thermonuclease family protein [Bacteriovoracaceae bacterium]
MRRPYQMLFPLLSLFIVRVDVTDLFPLVLRVKVLRVIDADTVDVRSGSRTLRVRLLKLDAPEKGQPFLDGNGDAGRVAENCAKAVISRARSYQLKLVKQDVYGRFLGELEDVSLRLIQRGCSGIYPYTEFSSLREKFEFLRALSKARRERVGLWNFGGYRQPMLWRKSSKQTARRRYRQSGRRPKTYPLVRRSSHMED